MTLNFEFFSSDHNRYEFGRHVSGPHGGAGRVVKVEPNINGGSGYSVSIYNMDGPHPVWRSNLQVGHKQMALASQSPDKIVLKGFGADQFGNPFSGFGLTIHLNNQKVSKCILHLFDRHVDLEYLP